MRIIFLLLILSHIAILKYSKKSFYREVDLRKNYNPAFILNYDYLSQPLSEGPVTSTNGDVNIVVPKFKLHACLIGKNFSNMLWSLFCYLYDEKAFTKKHRFLKENYWGKNICSKNIVESNFKRSAIKYNKRRLIRFEKEWKHIMVIRHPIDRFISAFTSLCTSQHYNANSYRACFTCGNDMKCLLNNIHYKMNSFLTKNEKVDHFLVYNFFPQTWQCQYHEYKRHYITIKYDSSNLELFYENLISLLEEQRISEGTVAYINNEIRNTTGILTKKHKDLNSYYKSEIYNDPYLLKMISIIYYNDFKEFNFDYPYPKIKI
uniref:Sulfotransfer_1 domain-containing protein n=1 Tax=Parastrongyloides trichosuri TaxID=131310 RepID=A0A0N4Z466_PARTI